MLIMLTYITFVIPTVDSIESKAIVTRKLRRRQHCDPAPLSEKRRKAATLSSLVYVLDDSEVEDDLKLLYKVVYGVTF